MTECSNNGTIYMENVCRACLRSDGNLHPMYQDDINYYQTMVFEVTNAEQDMLLCPLCRYLLLKCKRFSQQCQKANYILGNILKKESNLFTLTPHILTICHLESVHLGTENCDLEIVSPKIEDNVNMETHHFGDDDDEVPLVMLKSEETVDGDRVRKKKKKKSRSLNDKNHNGIKTEDDVKHESVHNSKTNTRDKCRSTKKVVKEGFSSRMVQETEEYIVIKLTKEQVLEEMRQKLESERYKRALYKCERCAKGFNFEDVLRSHMEKHTMENGVFQCDLCTQYCPSTVSLRGHLKSHTTRYKCKVCGDVRLSRQHLLEHHAISHTAAAASYSCDHCRFTTNKRTVIQRHVKVHKNSERHACHECGRLFQNIESLRVHTTRHDKSKSLQCEYCARKFIYPSLLQKHVQSVHVHEDYYCVECDVRFKSPENLRLHFKKAKRHRDTSSYTYECPQCEERFISSSSLSVHLTAAHGQPKRHACELCRRLYSSADSLKGHVRRVHAERQAETGQSCHICKKVFSRKSVLKVHVRTHTGERPHACACGAAFAQRASLRAHRAARHPPPAAPPPPPPPPHALIAP